MVAPRMYLRSTNHRNLECEEVGHQTLQWKSQAFNVHCVDKPQAPLEREKFETLVLQM